MAGRDRRVDDRHPVGGQPPREPRHLAGQPDPTDELLGEGPDLRQPVGQVEHVGQVALAGRYPDLAGHRELGDRELAHPGRALAARADQSVLGPHAPSGLGVAPRIARVDLRPGGHDPQVVHVGRATPEHGLPGQVEQGRGRQRGQVTAGDVEPERSHTCMVIEHPFDSQGLR
jgi:hypothetical protein